MKLMATQIDPKAATIDQPYPEGEPAHLELHVPVGRVELTPGEGDSLVKGRVVYNIAELAPTYRVQGRTLRIRQKYSFIFPASFNIENRWEMALGTGRPYSLRVSTGASRSRMNLSGLPLTSLEVSTGASDTEIEFNTPNPARLKQMNISTGASQTTITGLLNANFEHLKIGSGVGQTTVHFNGGPVQESGTVRIDGAVGETVLVLDASAPLRIKTSAALGGVRILGEGLELHKGGYETASYADAAARIDITVATAVGAVRLEVE